MTPVRSSRLPAAALSHHQGTARAAIPLAGAVALLAACSDQSTRSLTPPTDIGAQPSPGPHAAALPVSCQRTDASALQQQISGLFAASVRTTARTLERAVESGCPATTPMLDYVAAILGWRDQGLVTGTNTALWSYLTLLFQYTGYTLPNTEAALGAQGFIGICDEATMPAEGCRLIAVAKTSGILVYKGALEKGTLGRRFLVTGAPASCTTIGLATNLQPWGQCVEVSIDPKPGLSFVFAADPVARPNGGAVVQTCVAENAPAFLYDPDGAPEGKPGKMSQLSGGSARVSVRPPAPELFTITADDALAGKGCTYAQVVQREPGDGGALTRLARGALALFTPREAYAGHGGLGTLPAFVDATSRFGPIDPYLFQGTFTTDVVGQPPSSPDRGRGSWYIATLTPGDVLVQASLGDIASQLVVINQAGGNAVSKPGIQLVARVATQAGQPSFATTGVYRVRLRALVASSKPFGAPFIVRDSQGREIARFTYDNGSSAKSGPVLYNGVPVATWQQNISQRFEITVDLDHRVTSFGFQGATPLVSGAPFVAPAGDLAQAGWEITGRDGQIIGMDDAEIVALPDGPR